MGKRTTCHPAAKVEAVPAMSTFEWILLLAAGPGLFMVILALPVTVAMWERRLVWPYVPLVVRGTHPQEEGITADPRSQRVTAAGPDGDVLLPTDEAVEANDTAQALGFKPCGVFRDGKGKIYRIRYDFWLAPGADILTIVGGGTLLGIPFRSVWMHTRLADGRCLLTFSGQTAGEPDLTNLTVQKALHTVDFLTLLTHHRERTEASEVPVLPFAQGDPLADLRDFRARRTELLEAWGYAWFLDEERDAWRYTFKGALLLAARAYLTGVRRPFGQG
jgi:hypothetical protein